MTHPNRYLSDAELINLDPEDLGIENSVFCPPSGSACVSYLYAKAFQQNDFPEDSNVYYNVNASGNGVENSISYRAEPIKFNRIKGTAVLIHGYGGSKEAMMVTSIYFRAIGMDIIALDLFGHGESNNEFAFGAKEHVLYTQLISEVMSKSRLPQPVILVGHSMGALPAANTLVTSSIVDGAILLAPMIRFDLAAQHYLAYKNSTLNSVFSEQLGDIVSDALISQNVTINETDIPNKIRTVEKPVLIINSDVDSVSPSAFFSDLDSRFIQLEVFKNRSHPSLITFDKDDAKGVEDWLTSKFVESK